MPVMITNGNNVHAPEHHAEVTAAKLVQVDENAGRDKQLAARALRDRMKTILLAHHQKVHDAEQAALSTHGAARYDHQLDASEHFDSDNAGDETLVNELVDAARGTILEAHFDRPEVRDAILAELHHESRSQMNVHRLVHAAAERVASAKPTS